jgi:hypothetical protein
MGAVGIVAGVVVVLLIIYISNKLATSAEQSMLLSIFGFSCVLVGVGCALVLNGVG